jgi:hypothetical protein
MKQLAYFLPIMIYWQCEHWQLPLMASTFRGMDKLAREERLNAGLNFLASAITKDATVLSERKSLWPRNLSSWQECQA